MGTSVEATSKSPHVDTQQQHHCVHGYQGGELPPAYQLQQRLHAEQTVPISTTKMNATGTITRNLSLVNLYALCVHHRSRHRRNEIT